MKANKKYFVAVVLLAVLAIVFGLAGTVAPPMSQFVSPQQVSFSSGSSLTHFINPPTFDSGWVNTKDKCGQYVTLEHDLNTTEVVAEIAGRQGLEIESGGLAWSKTYGGTNSDGAESVVQTSDGGYALTGGTRSYGAGNWDFWLVKTDAAGDAEWNKTYGGADLDYCLSVVQTSGGAYCMAGYTDSFGAGSADFWLVRTDWYGTMMWNQTYGGAGTEQAYSVVQTGDYGYALAGVTTSLGAGNGDFWLVKTDHLGNEQWNKTYGGINEEMAYSMVRTADGGYVLAGYTGFFGVSDVDLWLVKTDAAGNMEWNQTYGGVNDDWGQSLVQTYDGGYAIAGCTYSYGAGSRDFWMVRTDAAGNMVWNQTYGGAGSDHAWSLVQTGDGGYALAGWTTSSGAGGLDSWLVKTDSTGVMQWNQTYGGTNNDHASSIVLTFDEGYAMAGAAYSFDVGSINLCLVKINSDTGFEHKINFGGTGVNLGWSKIYGGEFWGKAYSMVQTIDGGYAIAGISSTVFWLVKTDALGNVQWDQTYGGEGWDEAFSVIQTSDKGYAIAGHTTSFGAGDFFDLYLVKTDQDGNMIWNQTYGGAGNDYAQSVVQTADGGYAIAGYTNSTGAGGYDFWMVRTDAAGNMVWNQTYGGANDDHAFSAIPTFDGGYAIAGDTRSYGEVQDFWMVRTDSTGNALWNRTYGGPSVDGANSVIQTGDGGYALAGYAYWYNSLLVKTDSNGSLQWSRMWTQINNNVAKSVIQTNDGGYAMTGWIESLGARYDFWMVKTDAYGNTQWDQSYGGTDFDVAYSVTQASDEGFVIAGYTESYGAASSFWLIKTDVENGLAMTRLTNRTITLYRGRTDPYWNYVRVRMWLIKEPTWMFGDINQDGVVDAKDLAIIGRNYGKTFSALSLGGIIAIAGIYTYKKRKQPK